MENKGINQEEFGKSQDTERHEIGDFGRPKSNLNPELDKTQDQVDSHQSEGSLFRRVKKKQTVKTYRDFALQALRGKPTSLAKMIIQEKKKQEFKYSHSVKNKSNILMIILSVLLVLLGIGAIASVVVISIKGTADLKEKNTDVPPKSLIYFDYKKSYDIDKADRGDVLRFAKSVKENTNIPSGDIKIFYFIKKGADGYNILASSQDVFEKLDNYAKDILINIDGFDVAKVESLMDNYPIKSF